MKKKSGGQTLDAIEKEIARLKAEADKIKNDEVKGVIERIVVAIKHYGLTAEQLGFSGRGGKRAAAGSAPTSALATGVGVAKYRDPATGKTWTGRGKPPAWIAGVADRSKYEIAGSAAATAPRAKPGPKNAGVPKYQDPATGKTWTGNGKPPAWIAGAADRSKFEIGAAAATGAPKKTPGPKSGGAPKYRDPVSGKTWTGVGKAPGWIAGAADRDAFLISAAAATAG